MRVVLSLTIFKQTLAPYEADTGLRVVLSLTIFKPKELEELLKKSLRVVLSLTIFKRKESYIKSIDEFESSAIFNYVL